MFYCEPCRDARDWPQSFTRSFGPCELCAKHAECYDMSSAQLPKPPKNSDEAKPKLKSVEDKLISVYRAAARAYCLQKFNYDAKHYGNPLAREQHIANDIETYLSKNTRDTWFRPMIDAAITEYRTQVRRSKKKKSMHNDRIQELKDQVKKLETDLAAMEQQRDKWRDYVTAMGSDDRFQQWTAMNDVARAAEQAMDVMAGVSMVFSRSGGKTSIGNALVPLMEALTRYRHGPDAQVLHLGADTK